MALATSRAADTIEGHRTECKWAVATTPINATKAAEASTLAANLSGGQMKLLELARSLNSSPKMLLLDEPTAGVAPTLAREIFERIAQLRSELGLGIFVIEHRLEILFDYADEIYVMHLGQVITHGSPAEVAANAQVKEVYFGD